jgi:predicted nuclease of predicted toxin-antitoxin system
MKLWLDAHLSPALTGWLRSEFGIDALPAALRLLDQGEEFVEIGGAM